jgi:dTDP-4-amino-4,6-dideoxygalactose transaminase
MGVPLLDLGRQYVTIESSIRTRLDEVIRRQAFILGEGVQSFESAVADVVGARHAIGVASGTDALLLPLKALDLKPGDEVIAPAFTFFATAGAIHNAGGRPVFVDIEADTFNVSVDAIEAAITPRTRAIVPVHLFGQMADMKALQQLAEERGLFVLEDAAQAIGAAQRIGGDWHNAGTIGNATAFLVLPLQEPRRIR